MSVVSDVVAFAVRFLAADGHAHVFEFGGEFLEGGFLCGGGFGVVDVVEVHFGRCCIDSTSSSENDQQIGGDLHCGAACNWLICRVVVICLDVSSHLAPSSANRSNSKAVL